MSKANLAGHDFEGPAGSVGSFRSLKKVSGVEARAVESGSTGVLAPAGSPVGQGSTNLPLGP